METSTRNMTSRRWIGRLVRAGLVFLAIFLVAGWVWRRVPHGSRVAVMPAPAADAAMAPGDLRIYNRDSTVDLVLQADRILAGLSPKTVAKVQAKMQESQTKDTSGLGGLISSTVKQTVANAIGTHVAYPLSEVHDVRYEDGQLIIEKQGGGETRLFGDTKVNGRREGKLFSEEDAKRFIEAVRARKSGRVGKF